jgi:hypothetical protein
MKRMERPHALAPTLFLVGVIGVVAPSCGERARVAQADLRSEWSQIQIPPGGTITSQRDLPRVTRGLLGASFTSDSALDEIRRFYEPELASHGWQFRGERIVKNRSKALGEHEFIFCKGARSAHLYFPGPKSGDKTTYALELVWGGNACEDPVRPN